MYGFENHDIDEITDNLYLGNYVASIDISMLKKKGIKKILTVMNGSNLKYDIEDGFIQEKVEIVDFSDQNIIQYFGKCLNFIQGEEKVLVHCAAGASRSATIVIAYLMWAKKMKYDDAYQLVRDKRFIICPNCGFREQLKMFEKLLIENNYDLYSINFNEIKWEPPKDFSYF